MKRVIAILLSFVLIGAIGCDVGNNSSEQNDFANVYVEQTDAGFSAVEKYMWNNNGRLKNSTAGKVASLWTYGAYFTAVAKYLKVCNGSNANRYVDKALAELEWYKCKGKNAYASENGTESPVFFDDNAWIVFGLLEIYSVRKDSELLQKAIEVQNFIYSGWQEELGGGLLWREFDPLTTPASEYQRNTCINAPTAMNAALLYKFTNDQAHLDFAEKIFDWTKKTLKNTSLGTYYDCIDKNGVINKSQFTYNSGCMLSAAALLYDITGKEEYLAEARSIAQGSQVLFASKHVSPSVEGDFYHDNPWFRVYLFQGYLDACRYLGEEFYQYMDYAIMGYDYAVSRNFFDKYGFIFERWDGSQKPDITSETYQAEGRSIFGSLQSVATFAEYNLLIGEQ